MLFTQEPFFQQKQLNLIKKSIKVFNDEIYNQQLTKEQALDIFKDSILQQIEIHEHSHFLTAFRKKSPILKECAGRSPMSRWDLYAY